MKFHLPHVDRDLYFPSYIFSSFFWSRTIPICRNGDGNNSMVRWKRQQSNGNKRINALNLLRFSKFNWSSTGSFTIYNINIFSQSAFVVNSVVKFFSLHLFTELVNSTTDEMGRRKPDQFRLFIILSSDKAPRQYVESTKINNLKVVACEWNLNWVMRWSIVSEVYKSNQCDPMTLTQTQTHRLGLRFSPS